MTIEEFNNTRFKFGMKAEYKNNVYDIISVDFEENLIGLDNGIIECNGCGTERTDVMWVRCENCKIIMNTKEQKAKEYAESITGLDYMGEVEAERAYLSGWDEALKSQWISVKDRMPEYCKVVFVLHSSKVIEVSAYHADNNWSNFDDDIIAWMPIPSFEEILQANKDVLKRLKDR